MFALRDAIYLIELSFYGPIIPAIVFIILIHTAQKPYTWRPIVIPLLLLSGLRIAGSSLGLTALDPDKSSLLTTSTLLDTIGLAPVLCLLLGLLIRANAPLDRGLPIWAFLPLHLITIAATVMTAYGGRDLYTTRKTQSKDLKLMKAGIFLFIGAFSISIILAIITLFRARSIFKRTERTAAICALLCVPFMSVRLAYSAGSLFSGQGSVLNPLSDDDTSIWLHFLMVIVMEYIPTLSATAVALTARRMTITHIRNDEDKYDLDDESENCI
ncbi:hypothetical protein DTO282F9_4958 [Paecilomyces variotii]|nr:hypothetical protein DTO282F9_4958 [Paecilomyces variotii]